MKSIDLGRKPDDLSCPCPVAKSEGPRVYYPSLYLEGTGELKDLPESGTLTIRFKRVSKSETEREGKKRCTVELEVREIVDAKSGDASSDEDAEDVLDALRESTED